MTLATHDLSVLSVPQVAKGLDRIAKNGCVVIDGKIVKKKD